MARAQVRRQGLGPGQHRHRREPIAAMVQRAGFRNWQTEAGDQRIEHQLVVGDEPPLAGVALADDPVLGVPPKKACLVRRCEAPVVIEPVVVVLVRPQLAGAIAQPPDLPRLAPGALAVAGEGGVQAVREAELGVDLGVLQDVRGHDASLGRSRVSDIAPQP